MNEIDLDLVDINLQAMTLVSKELCEEYNIFPYDINSTEIHLVSFTEVSDEEIDKLRFIIKRKIYIALCDKGQYLSYMNKYYEEIYRKKILDEFKIDILKKDTVEEKKISGPIISIVDSILRDGICSRASDIHVEPWKDKVSVRFRIDGALKNFSNIPKNFYDSISTRIKVMGNMDITCKYTSQDGEISMKVGSKYYNLRISTLPTIFGEKFVIRILERDAPLLNLKNIGFTDKDSHLLRNILRFKQGLIIITGPTGSGKTTTLYSMINELNTESRNIVTVEKPVECEVTGVNQVAIGEQGNTYGSILRNVLRQDPDVIMVGEIIDRDTAEVAIRASLTGHLVLTTLHTNDASSAISRLTNMGMYDDC